MPLGKGRLRSVFPLRRSPVGLLIGLVAATLFGEFGCIGHNHLTTGFLHSRKPSTISRQFEERDRGNTMRSIEKIGGPDDSVGDPVPSRTNSEELQQNLIAGTSSETSFSWDEVELRRKRNEFLEANQSTPSVIGDSSQDGGEQLIHSVGVEVPSKISVRQTDRRTDRSHPRQRKGKSQRLPKLILACGSDSDRALRMLYEAFPFLSDEPRLLNGRITDSAVEEICSVDGKSISAAIALLGRTKELERALKLLDCVSAFWLSKRESNATRRDGADMRQCHRAAISAAGVCRDWQTALRILHHDMPQAGLIPRVEAYHAAICACGRCGAMDAVLSLIREMELGSVLPVDGRDGVNLFPRSETPRGSASIQQQSLVPPKPDRTAYQTALTACMRNKRCDEAVYLLDRMKQRGISPDVNGYNLAIAACSKAPGRHMEAVRILEDMENDGNALPNEMSYESVISACSKANAWEEASHVMSRMVKAGFVNGTGKPKSLPDEQSSPGVVRSSSQWSYEPCTSDYFSDLGKLRKVGTGRIAWWEIGRYYTNHQGNSPGSLREICIGLQPNRNPVRNGLSIVFLDALSKTKLGYMLIRNTAALGEKGEPNIKTSSLIGMFVEVHMRGQGLANLFMASWLRLCLDLRASPRAEKINKPLLALVLSRFGFVTKEGGVEVEVSKIEGDAGDLHRTGDGESTGWKPLFSLYSPSWKVLEGAFSERDLRIQRMAICKDPPVPRGKRVWLKTGFVHPQYAGDRKERDGVQFVDGAKRTIVIDLEERVQSALNERKRGDRLHFNASPEVLERAFFGFLPGF